MVVIGPECNPAQRQRVQTQLSVLAHKSYEAELLILVLYEFFCTIVNLARRGSTYESLH